MLTDGIKIEVYMRFSKQINVMCETCAKVFQNKEYISCMLYPCIYVQFWADVPVSEI